MVPLLRKLLFATLATLSITARPQVLNDDLEGDGNEIYHNGFGAFNWVDANNFGFPNNAGDKAFLSNYTGLPLMNIGMIKPLNATIGNSSYRVWFYYSRYSSVNAVPYSSYDSLYIGSPNGTMVWDTVPTPVSDGAWLRWSGVFTPAPQDIGQPFRFGFTMDLYSGSSLAIDGPLGAEEATTGVADVSAVPPLSVRYSASEEVVIVGSLSPVVNVTVFDGLGRPLSANVQRQDRVARIDTRGWSTGTYIVMCTGTDGATRAGRVVVM